MDDCKGDWKSFIAIALSKINTDAGSLRRDCLTDIFEFLRNETLKTERTMLGLFETHLQNEMLRIEDKLQGYVMNRMEGIRKAANEALHLSVGDIVSRITDVLQKTVEAARNEEKKAADDKMHNLESEFQERINNIRREAMDEIKEAERRVLIHKEAVVKEAEKEKSKMRETMEGQELEFKQVKNRLEAAIASLGSEISKMQKRVDRLVQQNELVVEKRDILNQDLQSFYDLAHKASSRSLVSSRASTSVMDDQ